MSGWVGEYARLLWAPLLLCDLSAGRSVLSAIGAHTLSNVPVDVSKSCLYTDPGPTRHDIMGHPQQQQQQPYQQQKKKNEGKTGLPRGSDESCRSRKKDRTVVFRRSTMTPCPLFTFSFFSSTSSSNGGLNSML
jgi:hypothetical protein